MTKLRNHRGNFEDQIAATDFKVQTRKPVVTGFEAKLGETIPVILRPNY
jgi:hypothetical protein